MSTREAAVLEIVERAIEFTRSFAIWWTLVNKENFERYAKVIDHHEDFFAATTHSLFLNFSVIAYQLFERRKDTTSIPSLIESFAPSHSALAQQLKANIDAKKPLLGKVFSIRNNVYAHRNRLQPPEHFFAASGLTATEMETVVRFAQDMVAAIAEAEGVETKVEIEAEMRLRDQYSREDTRLIMETLQKHAL